MTEEKSMRVERRADDVAVIYFDVPGETMNTLRSSFADELAAIFEDLERDDSLRGVVVASGKPDSFIAGADISMLDSVNTVDEAVGLARVGQEAVDRISACRVPVVAAIHGACLGGGLELALACQGRVASHAKSTKLGLPEVQLGILPGMGGTQRLPRLVGLQSSLDLLLTGKQLDARRARKIGLVDEVVSPSLVVSVAAARALQLESDQRRSKKSLSSLREMLGSADLRELAMAENPLGRKVVFDQARKRLLEKSHGNYPAPERILDVVKRGLESGLRTGLEAEAEAFGRLVVSDEAKALRHIYFSQQALKKDPGAPGDEPPLAVGSVGILGAGLMGAGIGYVSVTSAGARVRLKDVKPESIQNGLKYTAKLLDDRVRKRRISVRERDQLLARISRTTEYTGFHDVDVVIEAVFEDIDLKRRVLADVEEAGSERTIFASNTSALKIGEIARDAKDPSRVIGMHYFSPVHKMPLLEIITTEQTAPWVTRACVQLGKKQGKTVIVVGDGPGFYTTRILGPYLNEAAFALLEGLPVEEIDDALVDAGFPVGPLALLDEVGIDVGAKVGATLEEAFGKRLAPPKELARLKESGRLGRKNDKGLYDYTFSGKGKRPVDETVYADLGLSPEREELEPDALAAKKKDVAERCLLAMVNEAYHCLGEGILKSERDGDIGAIFGLGFPPFLGGPFHYVRAVGKDSVVSRLRAFEERFGERFTPADSLLR